MTIRADIKKSIQEQLELRNSMSDEDWIELCTENLFKILEEHKDVLIRLTDR